ncbi:MAG: HDOD domain-containing protein [Planctomycetota bacterium]
MIRPGLPEVTAALPKTLHLPLVASQLLSLLQDPNSSIADVRRVLTHDPELSKQVMALSRNNLVSQGKDVPDLNAAVSFLGFETLKSVILSLSILQSFPKTQGALHFNVQAFNNHSVAAAVVYRRLAREEGLHPDIGFLCGLLHDVGKILMNMACPREFEQALIMADRAQVYLHNVEGLVFATNHAQVGAWLARSWSLPPDLVSFIETHHKPDPHKPSLIHAIAELADSLLIEKGLECPGSFGERVPPDSIWRVLRTPHTRIPGLLRDLDRDLKLATELFTTLEEGD